jgi:hypothetical protein
VVDAQAAALAPRAVAVPPVREQRGVAVEAEPALVAEAARLRPHRAQATRTC